MRKLLLAAASLAAVGATANAQALEFNVGAFGGFARGETEWDYVPPPDPIPTFDTDGGMLGVNAGVGATFSGFYIGAEADYAWASINGQERCPNPSWACEAEVESLATLRAVFGRQVGPWLFYGTGGVAQGDVHIQTQLSNSTAFGSGPEFGETQSRDGWAAGIGVRRDVGPHLSWRAEYLHVELDEGTSTVDFGLQVQTQTTLDAVRLGVDWNF